MSHTEEPNSAREVSAAGLRADFEASFGYSPSGLFRAPGRVNLIGEHTDYNEGLVLPIAIDRAVHIAIGQRTSGTPAPGTSASGAADVGPADSATTVRAVSNHRDDNGERLTGQFDASSLTPGSVTGWLGHIAGVVDELMKISDEAIEGIDLYIDSTVPVGAGLSSSHALEVASLIALDELYSLRLDHQEKVLLTQRAENRFVGAPTGIVDQSASIMATPGHALFLDCRDFNSKQIPFDPRAHGLALMVIDTRVIHSHSESGYGQRRQTCEEAARRLGVASVREITDSMDLSILSEEQLRRVTHVRTENDRVRATVAALEAGDIRAIGELFLASHESLARDYEVSCGELDLTVSTAMDAGAVGARMTGGGFGGSAIALVDAELIETVSAAIHQAFAEAALTDPHIFVVDAGGGAGPLSD